MQLETNPQDAEYRARAREWLAGALPPGWGRSVREPSDEEQRIKFRHKWDRELFAGGWAGITWPRAYGGQGATVVQKAIFLEESARVRAPEGMAIVGRNVVGPTIIAHGSEEQKKRFIRPILAAEEIWCLGLSEPNSGSDLASVRCRADAVPGGYTITGQKVWTSYAQYASRCLLLARTDTEVPAHRGLTLFLLDMKAPGVTVRPLTQLTGASEFNEVFFDGVFVPADCVVGQPGGGWQILQTSLAAERGPEEGMHRQTLYKQYFDELVDWAHQPAHGRKAPIGDPIVRQRLAQSFVELEIMRLDCIRGLAGVQAKRPPGASSSVTKLYWSHMIQRVMDTAMELQAPGSILSTGDPDSPSDGLFQFEFLWSRAATIYSGASQIQRNVIAERILGLPKAGR